MNEVSIITMSPSSIDMIFSFPMLWNWMQSIIYDCSWLRLLLAQPYSYSNFAISVKRCRLRVNTFLFLLMLQNQLRSKPIDQLKAYETCISISHTLHKMKYGQEHKYEHSRKSFPIVIIIPYLFRFSNLKSRYYYYVYMRISHGTGSCFDSRWRWQENK